jgi:hypothetical protein
VGNKKGLKALDTMLKDTNKYIRDIASTRVKKIVLVLFKVIRKHDNRHIGGC